MSAVNPLIEPGDTEAPSIPREEPEAKQEAQPELKLEPKVEPKAEETPKEEPPKDTDAEKYRKVQAALKEERQTKAELKKELESAKAAAAQYEAMRKELDDYRKARQAEQEKAKFEENPAEYLKQKLDAQAAELERVQTETQQRTQHEVMQQQFYAVVQSDVAEFTKANPDYQDAFNFVADKRMKEYEILGLPKEHWQARFNQESIELSQHALQIGKSPAEMAYQMAKVWGYTGPGKTQPVAQSPEKEIERIQEGLKASASLSTGGKGEESFLKKIDDMSDAEFDKFWNEELKPKHR